MGEVETKLRKSWGKLKKKSGNSPKIWYFSRKSDFFPKISIFSLSKITQVMSPYHSDQMSQRSQMALVALCMSKVKVPWVTRSPIELFWTAKNILCSPSPYRNELYRMWYHGIDHDDFQSNGMFFLGHYWGSLAEPKVQFF